MHTHSFHVVDNVLFGRVPPLAVETTIFLEEGTRCFKRQQNVRVLL